MSKTTNKFSPEVRERAVQRDEMAQIPQKSLLLATDTQTMGFPASTLMHKSSRIVL